jgi:hypothetical protein
MGFFLSGSVLMLGFLPENDPTSPQPAIRTLSSATVDVRAAIFRTNGFSVTPWATTLSNTVRPAANMIVSLPGSFSTEHEDREDDRGQSARLMAEVRFATDSLVEESGFEPLVPLATEMLIELARGVTNPTRMLRAQADRARKPLLPYHNARPQQADHRVQTDLRLRRVRPDRDHAGWPES